MDNYVPGPSGWQYPGGYAPTPYMYATPAPAAAPYTMGPSYSMNGVNTGQNGTPFQQNAYVTPMVAASPQLPTMQPPKLGRPQYILNQDKKPLKSALKKPKLEPVPQVSLSRTSSRQRRNSFTRQRTNSGPASYVPDHIFVSFHNKNKLRVENIVRYDMFDRLEDVFLSQYEGATADRSKPSRYELQFPGRLWDSEGHAALQAYRLIRQVFMVLAEEGFHYVTSINASHAFKPPRLVFANLRNPAPLDFFCAALANGGYDIMIYDAPAQLAVRLGLDIKARFPNKVTSHTNEHYVCTIKLKQLEDTTEKNFIISYIFKYLSDEGYYIDASVPLARKGLLGLGGRQEIWLFKSILPPTLGI